MAKQTHFRTFQIKRNDNLSVPIGNLVLVQAFFERFGLDEAVRAFKTKGTDLAKLAEAMVAYRAGDNFSILRCHDFMMQSPIRQHLGLPEFDVRGLYRAVELLGRNKEPIVTPTTERSDDVIIMCNVIRSIKSRVWMSENPRRSLIRSRPLRPGSLPFPIPSRRVSVCTSL